MHTQVIVLSGKHQLNKDDIILQSEGRIYLADDGRDEGLIGISIKNQSTADVKNYSLEIEVSFYFILLALGFGFQRPAAISFPKRSGAGNGCKTAATQNTPGFCSALYRSS